MSAQGHREELSRERSRDLDEIIKGGDRLKEAREAVYNAKESFVKQKTLLGEINVLISEIKAENDRLAVLNKSLESLEKEKQENNSAIESAENGISLMKDKNMPIYEIAQRVGYKDYRYFSGTFKKYIGIGPKEYQMRT